MHRFFLPPAASAGDCLELTGEEAHHAWHAVRVQTGEHVVVLDGAGLELLCEVTGGGRRRVDLRVRQRRERSRLPFRLTLFQAITKTKSMDWIIQKATELGAARVVPLLCERSVPRLDAEESAHRVEKWRATAIEALKQCGTPWLPEIEPPSAPAPVLAHAAPVALSLLTSLQPGARHLRACLDAARAEGRIPPNDVAVWVGPEGDFTPTELAMIQSAGAQPISLGPLVLRSETAAVYCLSVLGYELQPG